MKKLISVVLCVLMLMTAMFTAAEAAELITPDTPAVNGFADGVASWEAVDGAAGYYVQLYKWNYDGDTWTWVKDGKEILTAETAYDFTAALNNGKYTFTVRTAAVQTIEKGDGTSVDINRFSAASELPEVFGELDNPEADKAAYSEKMVLVNTEDAPWEPADGNLPAGIDLPDGEVKDALSAIKYFIQLIRNIFEYFKNLFI